MTSNGKTKHRNGRPPRIVIDPMMVDRLCAYIRLPSFPEVAAVSVGLPRATFYRYMQRGADHVCDPEDKERNDPGCKLDDHPYRDFRDAIEKAKTDAEVALTGIIRSAASGLRYRVHVAACTDPQPGVSNTCACPIKVEAPNWFAAARMLESVGKARWLRTERIEHTGADGGPVEVAESPADRITKQTRKVAQRLLAQMGEGKANGRNGS